MAPVSTGAIPQRTCGLEPWNWRTLRSDEPESLAKTGVSAKISFRMSSLTFTRLIWYELPPCWACRDKAAKSRLRGGGGEIAGRWARHFAVAEESSIWEAGEMLVGESLKHRGTEGTEWGNAQVIVWVGSWRCWGRGGRGLTNTPDLACLGGLIWGRPTIR